MTTKIPLRDIETFSSYLDGQLSDQERKGLEARLGEDANLRAALENMRFTRETLRRVPQLRVPRNFTLTPEMAGKPVFQSRLFSSMQLVSAMASFLFFMVFFGDILFNVILPGNSQADQVGVIAMSEAEVEIEPEGETVELEMAVEDSAQESSRSVETVPAEAPAAEAGADAEFAYGDAFTAEEMESEIQPNVEADDTTGQAIGSGQPLPEEALTPESLPESVPDEAPSQSTPLEQITPTEVPVPEPAPTISTPESEVPESRQEIPLVRIIEGALALLAVGVGLSAYIFRRLNR